MSSNSARKLVINREVVRVLTDSEVAQVAGGGGTDWRSLVPGVMQCGGGATDTCQTADGCATAACGTDNCGTAGCA